MWEWIGLIVAAVILIGLAVLGSYSMKSMQNRRERGMGDGGPDATNLGSDDTAP